jgi:hypothetical protein
MQGAYSFFCCTTVLNIPSTAKNTALVDAISGKMGSLLRYALFCPFQAQYFFAKVHTFVRAAPSLWAKALPAGMKPSAANTTMEKHHGRIEI